MQRSITLQNRHFQDFAVIDFIKTLMLKNTVSKQAIRLVFAITKKILLII